MGAHPKPGQICAEEIVERCILAMINEAAMCLDEGVVATPDELDLGMIMGTGFPPFRGGLVALCRYVGASGDRREAQEV